MIDASSSSVSPLLGGLNPVQHRAVTLEGGPGLVLAGAGSGKTRVLTRRIAWLIRERGVAPHRLLAVTFTNKAAGEMRARVEDLLGMPARGLWIGTFHATGLRWLRRHAREAGFGADLSVYDADDQRTLLRGLLKAEGFDHTPRRARELGSIISRWKNRGEGPDAAAAEARGPAQQVAARFYRLYQEALRARAAADFDDLLLGAHRLFEAHPEIADHYAEQFRHVLVDEYQDTNHVQFMLVERLARRHRNLFVVGDDDQSIYGWRGAEVRNILDFKEHFPEATVLYLEQNYRSTPPILELANAVIAHNTDRWPKRLWTERPVGPRPQFFLGADEDEEAEEVARRVDGAAREGAPLREVAVFYRTHAQSRPLEDAFLRRRLPYVLVGGVYFYERREVKDLLAYLRVLANPLDEVALRRAVGSPRRGVGDTGCEAWLAEATARAADPLELAAGGEMTALGGKARASLAEFARAMLQWRARLAEPPEVMLSEIVSQTGYDRFLEEQGGDWEERRANVRELVEGARLFSSQVEAGGVREYLDQVSLLTSADLAEAKSDAVTMMTVHNAKGLEFPRVFVVGLEEGLFPHASAFEDPTELEEERRLFYVACTRAMDRLVLSASALRRRYSSGGGGVSRFLAEIPEGLIEETLCGEAPRRMVSRERTLVPETTGYASPEEHPLVGRRVHHVTFGHGIVTAAEGEGSGARVTVHFSGGRSRKVVGSYLEWES
jgi:DNA helicase II / ATP-dependent DNA helicase PcrA